MNGPKAKFSRAKSHALGCKRISISKVCQENGSTLEIEIHYKSKRGNILGCPCTLELMQIIAKAASH